MSDGNISPTLFEHFFGADDLDSQVSKLQALLENESLAFDTESLLQALQQCLSTCTVESLDEQIFKKVLPKAQHFLSQVVKAIDDNVTGDNVKIDNLNDVKRKLCICDGLLIFWEKCVEYVSTLEKVRALYIISLCDILPETIKIVFEHCKASPKYGVLLSGAMQDLRNLFVKAGAIFKLFFATLDGVIVFDTNVQSETELLTKVIDVYGSIASIANGMDTKTFVELSEAFAQLAVIYQNNIEPNSIIMHIDRMTKEVSYFLSNIKDQKDKNAERNVVVTTRLLKVLEKLTAAYGAFLTYETMSGLIEFLAQVHGYSCLSLIRESERTISVGVASFLNTIFNHDDFKQAYFEYGKQIVSHGQHAHQLNYHLLTIALMKKLNDLPYEYHCRWSLGSDSILDVAFTCMEHLEEEICTGELRLPSAHGVGERPRLAGVYEATLVPICHLVSQIPPEGFHALELLLLKHLLSGRLWSSLLSSDVWCFVGRLGTSQLCTDHIKYLIKVAAALIERRDSMEVVMLHNMIVRLYELLTEDMKSTLLDNLVDLDTNHYALLLHLLVLKSKPFSSERLKRKFEDLPKVFLDLQEHPSTYNWERLTQLISTLVAMNYSNNKDIIDVLIKIWSFIRDAIIKCEGKQLDILSDLIVILLDATCFGSLQDDIFCAILTSIATSCTYLPPRGKIKVCYFLRWCVEDFGRCGIRNIAFILIELFSRLLEDDDPWVRQEALETFEHVGHTCPEQLVAEIAKALAKIPNISSVMQAYLSSRPCYILKDFANVQDYLRYLAKIIQSRRNEHTCHEYDESEREDKMPKLEKEKNSCNVIGPIQVQLDDQAEELYKGLMKVMVGQAVINNAVCKKLITILEKIIRSCEK